MIITIIRKPFESKSVCENIALHSTGSLNIDSCRVGTENMSAQWDREWNTQSGVMGRRYDQGLREKGKQVPDGRWPANLLLSTASQELMDTQSGFSVSRKGKPRGTHEKGMFANSEFNKVGTEHNDCGGASRFFKVIK